MNKSIRLSINNRAEIIDRNSPYYGKKGTVVNIVSQPMQMINANSKPIKSTKILCIS